MRRYFSALELHHIKAVQKINIFKPNINEQTFRHHTTKTSVLLLLLVGEKQK